MRLFRVVVLGAATTLVMGVAVAGVASAQGGDPVSAGGPSSVKVVDDPPAAPVVAPQATRPIVVTLATGDQVRVDGQNVTPLGTGRTPLMRFDWDGDTYAVPATALPYLGSTLDIRLFDVSYLAQVGGAAPVTITTTGTAAPLAAGTTTLDGATAQSLGTHIKARNLTGIKRIGLAQKAGAPALPAAPATTAPATASPAAKGAGNGGGLAYDTLTINTIDHTGAPGEAFLMVQNLDDPSLALFLTESEGSSSYSLPEGNYSVESNVLTPDGDGFDAALVVNPQFAMHGDKTITLDARLAKPFLPALDSSITAPAARLDTLEFTRTGATGDAEHGGGFNMALLAASPNPLPEYLPYVLSAAPTSAAAVHIGRFDFEAYSFQDDSVYSGGLQSGPAYVMAFPHAGSIPDGLSYHVRQADLTTVDNELYEGPDGGGTTQYLAFSAYEPWGDSMEAEIAVDGDAHTDYWYSAEPNTEQWQIRVTAPDWVNRFSAFYSAQPGGQVHEVWNKGPMVPSPAASTIINMTALQAAPVTPNEAPCPACRQDDNVTLFLNPFGDSDPAHASTGWYNLSSSTIRFSRNGIPAVSSADAPGGGSVPLSLLLPMLHQRASYELDWSMARLSDPAAVTDTDWTFTSAPGVTTKLPATEQCTPDAGRACATLPLLFVNYDLALDHQSQAPSGSPFTVAFTLGYQQGAPAATGLGATVSVSYDDGATWSTPQAAHADGNGRFSVGIQHPDSTGFVSLRVEAHDGAGNAVRQTVIRAYRLVQQ